MITQPTAANSPWSCQVDRGFHHARPGQLERRQQAGATFQFGRRSHTATSVEHCSQALQPSQPAAFQGLCAQTGAPGRQRLWPREARFGLRGARILQAHSNPNPPCRTVHTGEPLPCHPSLPVAPLESRACTPCMLSRCHNWGISSSYLHPSKDSHYPRGIFTKLHDHGQRIAIEVAATANYPTVRSVIADSSRRRSQYCLSNVFQLCRPLLHARRWVSKSYSDLPQTRRPLNELQYLARGHKHSMGDTCVKRKSCRKYRPIHWRPIDLNRVAGAIQGAA